VDKNRGLDKDRAATDAERRDRKVPGTPDHTPDARRKRKPTVLGMVVATGAVGAWLLRRERVRAPEGTWRDALLSDASGTSGKSGSSGPSGTPRAPGPGTDER
jgi:hypothetical protein